MLMFWSTKLRKLVGSTQSLLFANMCFYLLKIEQSIFQGTLQQFHTCIFTFWITHSWTPLSLSRTSPSLSHLLQIGCDYYLPFSNRKLSSCREEVPAVLEVPVLFCRAWLYSPPGTPALCLCNHGAPTSLACLWRTGGGGCQSASGSRRQGGAWPSEEFPSTPGAPLWTRAWVRDRNREKEAEIVQMDTSVSVWKRVKARGKKISRRARKRELDKRRSGHLRVFESHIVLIHHFCIPSVGSIGSLALHCILI